MCLRSPAIGRKCQVGFALISISISAKHNRLIIIDKLCYIKSHLTLLFRRIYVGTMSDTLHNDFDSITHYTV